MIGRLISARYRLIAPLGEGGMATIWRAVDEQLDREVAVKLLRPQFSADPGFAARFKQEARSAGGLSHPNIVGVYDYGTDGADGDQYIVMELIEGNDLSTILRDRGSLSTSDAVRVAIGVAAALEVAHRKGIVHRDVKPGNLLLDERGRLGVADFGIARLAFESSVTQTGQVLGTAAYVSPEQARGEGASAASDRYSLAVVAYELLTGTRPYGGGTFAAQARQHMEADPTPVAEHAPGLPSAVDSALRRGLAKAPAARWPTATAFAEALVDAAGRRPASASEPTAPPTVPTVPLTPIRRPVPPPDPRRRRALLAPAALLGAVLLAVILAIALSGGDDGSRPEAKRTPTSQATPQRPRTNTRSTPAATPPATAVNGESASSLNDRGFALMSEGRYGEAIPLLERAVERCGDSRESVCAYALYNLGRSLRLAGRPAEAIPILERRLAYNDQTETVQAELDAALAAAGQSAPAPSGGEDGKPGKGNGKAKGNKEGDEGGD